MSGRIRRPFVAAALLACLLCVPALALAAGTVTVSVKQGGVAVPGAFVALIGTGTSTFGAVTDTNGDAVFSAVPDGTYSVKSSTQGTKVASSSVTVSGAAVSLAMTLSASGTIFSALGVYGSQTEGILSGGLPGVFYLSSSAIPSVYRTADYGGTWSPVTLSSDDAASGIDGTDNARALTTSGYPGEVAAIVRTRSSTGSKLWYSRDYGVTWTGVDMPTGNAANGSRLYWSHPVAAGAKSVLFVTFDATTTNIYSANMPVDSASPAPVLTLMASSYKTSASDPITLVNGSDAGIFVVAHTTGGTVDLYKVDDTPSASDTKVTLTGMLPTLATDGTTALTSSDAFLIRLGGPLSGLSVGGTIAPNTLLLYSDKSNDSAANARAVTCTGNTVGSCAATTTTQFKDDFDANVGSPNGTFTSFGGGTAVCGANREAGAIGSVSPLGGSGSLGSCWITVRDSTLEVRRVLGINNNTGLAFDAGYGSNGDFVLISGDGGKGAIKSAKPAANNSTEGFNRPYFPQYPVLSAPGTAAGSGGAALKGLDSPVVTGVAFSPDSPNRIATILSFTGGSRVVGSTNAGQTWFDIHDRGGTAIAWWGGAPCGSGCPIFTPSWLVGASAGAGNLLMGTAMSTSAAFGPSTTLSLIAGTTAQNLGLNSIGSDGFGETVAAMAPVTHTNRLIVAVARRLNNGATSQVSAGALSIVTLSPGSGGGALGVGVAPVSGGTLPGNSPTDIAYCPSTLLGSAAGVADKAFVAVAATLDGGSTGGGIGVISNVSSSPSFQMLTTVTGDFRTIKVQCASGTIWAGKYISGGGASPSAPMQSGLVRSTDAGLTFSPITFTGTMLQVFGRVRLIALHPTNAKRVIAASQSTDIIETKDGGTTWAFLNDTVTPCDPAKPAKCGRHFGSEGPGALALPGVGLTSSLTSSLALEPGIDSSARASAVTNDTAVVGSSAGLYAAATPSLEISALNFGAVPVGGSLVGTSGQRVNITFATSGTVNWTAMADQSFVTLTPASGTGTGSFVVSVSQAGTVAPGTYRSVITVQTTGALVSTQYIDIVVTVAAASSAAFGTVDTPADNATGIDGSLPVTGWALDDVEVKRIRIMRDPVAGEGTNLVFLGDAVLVAGARPDVEAQNLTRPFASRAGWGYLMLTNMLPNQGNGTFRLSVFADDAEGNAQLLGTRTVTINNAQGTTPFGAIDTPGQGDTINGATYANFGWVLSRGTVRADPPGGGTVSVFVNSLNVGSPGGWTSRADLTALFPPSQYTGVTTALAVFTLNTTALINGVHTIAWVVTDNAAKATGIGSRYFTVQNGSSLTLDDASVHGVLQAGSSISGWVDSLPLRRAGVSLQRGYGGSSFESLEPDASGRISVRGREVTRMELGLGSGVDSGASYTGYSMVAGQARPLPIGASLDAARGIFSWQPGPGFVGRYDLVFVRDEDGDAQRIPVTVTLEPFLTRQPDPRVMIDAPAFGSTVGRSFLIGGWAADLAAPAGAGVDVVHVWAYPLDGVLRTPIFLGAPEHGGRRPDVAAALGGRFGNSAFTLPVWELPPGTYDIVVYARSTVSGTFSGARAVRVTVK